MLVDGTPRDLGDRAYLLSPQDLAAYDLIQELTEAGVVSFKIEGRLKGGPYVAATTQTYRSAIDAAVAGRDFSLPKAEQLDLAQTFSRGFTPGFLDGVDHQRLVQGRFPKSRGNLLGRVVGFARHAVKVRLHETLPAAALIKAGDGVVFDLGKPEEREPGGRVWRVEEVPLLEDRAATGGTGVVALYFEPNAVDWSSLPIGCAVWKTDDPVLRKRLQQSNAGDRPARRMGLSIHVSGRIGTPLRIAVHDADRREVRVEWPGPLALARTQPLTREAFIEQFDRLIDTPFALERVEMDLPDPVMVPRSALNDLRRQAVAQLMEMREKRHEIVEADALERLRSEFGEPSARVPAERATLAVLVRTLEQLDAVLAWQPAAAALAPVDMVYCDFEDTLRYREAVSRARESGRPIGLATLRILQPGEEGLLRPILSAQPDAVLVRNLASLDRFRRELPSATLIGDFSLNVANELTAELLVNEGLTRLVPSYDLNWDQLVSLVRRSDPSWFEPVIHQHMPMFHMEHCVFAAFLSTGKDHRDCGRPCDRHRVGLRDRIGAEFPVLPDTGCRNTVFNAVAQSAAEYVTRMQTLGLHRFRIDLLLEKREQIGPLLDRYTRVLAGLDDGRQTWRQLQALNQLGVTRGTLQMA
jgi:putative protease